MKLQNAIKKASINALFLAMFLIAVPLITAAQGKIAFMSQRNGIAGIFVMNSDGSNPMQLTNTGDFEPAFSPDGSKIAFHSFRDGNAEIYVMNSDGSNQINLTNNAAT